MSNPAPPVWAAEITLPPVAPSVHRARSFVADHLATHQLGTLAEDISLVVSELASNALIHARTPFTVFVRAQREGVSVAVKDGLSSFIPPPGRPGPLDEGGRGLLITEELRDAWGMRQGAYGAKYVWTFFALPRSTRPGFLPGRGWQEPGEPDPVGTGPDHGVPVEDRSGC